MGRWKASLFSALEWRGQANLRCSRLDGMHLKYLLASLIVCLPCLIDTLNPLVSPTLDCTPRLGVPLRRVNSR